MHDVRNGYSRTLFTVFRTRPLKLLLKFFREHETRLVPKPLGDNFKHLGSTIVADLHAEASNHSVCRTQNQTTLYFASYVVLFLDNGVKVSVWLSFHIKKNQSCLKL